MLTYEDHIYLDPNPIPSKNPKTGNKYAHLALPQRELDFHQLGILTENQIIQITNSFLFTARKDHLKKVLIITGKGLHSDGGKAVIKPLVENLLLNSNHVHTYSWAPIHRGGTGAFEITLE